VVKLKSGYCIGVSVWLCCFVSVVSAQTVADPALRVTELVGGLSQPTAMAFIGPNDLLVLQKSDGRVRRVTNGVLQSGEVLDVHVDHASESGLLGIGVHPNFPATNSSIRITQRAARLRIHRVLRSQIVFIVMPGTEALCSIRSLFSTSRRPLAES
jgi:glucose/arabinose dehydrogenase